MSESRIIDLISILNDLEENDFVRSKVPEHDLSLMIHCGEEQDILLHWDGDYTEFIFHSEMAGDVDSDYCYVNSEALNLFLSQFDPLEERVGKAAFKWFDYTEDISHMSFEQVLNIRIDEFPDVTFRYDAYDLTAVDGDGEAHILFSGMPIWSVYFCDLNADGYPEICSETSFGSGMIDNRIIVYDYADGVPYLLEDRGFHDYHLRRSETDGRLYADQVAYNSADLVASCRLILKNGSLQLDSTSSHLGDDKIVIRARLLEIHDGYYLVEPLDGNWKPGGVQVPMENVVPSPEPEVGDILQIEYEGSVQDINHSVWISNVCRISVAEEAPIVKVPTDTDLEGLWAGVLLVPIDGNVYRYDLTEGNPKGVYVDELLYTFTEETHVEGIVWEVYSLKEYPDKTAVLMLSGTNSAWLCEYSPPRRCSDTALNNAIAAGYAVTEDGIATHGQDVWNQFYELTQQGKEASITVAHYYTLDPLRCDAAYYAAFKQDYPCLYLDQLSYDGKQYILTKGEGETGTYEYLMKYETTIYSTMSSQGTGNEYNYVLTHDNRVTFDQLWQSLTSSWSAYHIDHYIIYSEQH